MGHFVLAFILYPLSFSSAFAQASICASVRIEILQQLTLERQAFEARMTINNGLAVPLEGLGVDLSFADKNNTPVAYSSDPTASGPLFFVRYETGSGLPASIAAGATNTVLWLIVPTPGAAGQDPQGTPYYVGATLRYTASGVTNAITVTPDTISVLPLPDLTLDYFLPDQVYADDPFTTQIEPPIPFSLGVRVKNTGYGWARSLKIDSAQPTIVDNKLGLAVDFKILGSEVNGNPATASLLADFGDLAPNLSGVARWTMISTLSGRFTDFTAHYTHSDDLGGQLTSLLAGQPTTHTLIRDVLVDLPGRDNIRDFLARDGVVLRVYESQNADTKVPDYSTNASISTADGRYSLQVPGFGGFGYVKLADPLAGQSQLASVTRGDGKVLNPANAWLSSTWVSPGNYWTYFVNVFDANNGSGLSYTLAYNLPPSPTNRPPRLDPLQDWTLVAGNYLSFPITASDPDANKLTFALDPGAPAGAAIDPVTGLFTWRPTQSQAPSTNLVRVRVTDNGTPNLSDAGAFSVIVKRNSAPALTALPNYYANALQLLSVQASATDGSLAANQLYFSLEPGAPDGAGVDPTNGLFTWIPSRQQATTTNVITLTVTDSGAPPLSDSKSFTVVVSDYTELTLGFIDTLAGLTDSVPLTAFSSIPLTSVSLAMDYPGDRLTNWAAQPWPPMGVDGYSDPTNGNRLYLSFAPTNSQPFISTQALAYLSFSSLTNGRSAMLPLMLAQGSAVRADGGVVTNVALNHGRVVLIVREPVLQASVGDDGTKSLDVHGLPGTTYWVEYTTNLVPPLQWTEAWPITLDPQSMTQGVVVNPSGSVIIRLRQQ